MKTCCCTGHRPKGFPFKYGVDKQKHKTYLKTLEQKIKLAITEYGITNFISGMALGADLDFAEIVLKLRNKYPIFLECAIPCPNQTLNWNDKDILRYESILKHADKVRLISEQYTPDCMLKRNRYMVDKSQLVIAVFNGIESGGTWYTIDYAKKQNKLIEIIDLCKVGKTNFLKYILIGVSIFVAVMVIEFCCIYAVQRENVWNFYKDFWDWYKTLLTI